MLSYVMFDLLMHFKLHLSRLLHKLAVIEFFVSKSRDKESVTN